MRLGAWLATLGILISLSFVAQSEELPLACGINYNFSRLNEIDGSACARDASAPISGQAMLTRWNDPEIRAVAERQLRDLARAGFTSVRFLVWYGKAEQRLPQNGFDLETDRERAATAVTQIVDLARQAGMRQIMVGFSPLGFANPGCRRAEYGDCFQPGLTEAGAGFVTSVAAAAVNSYPDTIIDLQNEGCVTPGMQPRLVAQTTGYTNAVAQALAGVLPATARVTMSIILSRGMDCVRNAVETVERAGFRRGPVSVHVYSAAALDVLAQAGDYARAHGRDLIIGEAPLVMDDALAQRFRGSIAALPPGVLRALILWPTDGRTRCAVNQTPPYSLPAGMRCGGVTR